MDGNERDSTQDWILAAAARPPSVRDLELKVDEALAIARSSEAAVCVIGDAALEAAKQAGRAAELAERASAAALAANREVIERGAATARNVGPATVFGGADDGAAAPEATTVALVAQAPRAAEAASATRRSQRPAPQDCFERFSARADRLSSRFRALQRA